MVVADLVENEKFVGDEKVTFIKCNVAQKDSVDKMVAQVMEKYGKIDGLLNNAGVSRPRLLVDFYGKASGV